MKGPDRDIKIANFYKNMINPPRKEKGEILYGYSSTGDLLATHKDGSVVSSIPLHYYRSYTKDEITSLDLIRKDNIINLETLIDIEHGLLRKAYADFKLTGDAQGVVLINQRIHDLELKKLYYRSPILTSVTIEAPEIRTIFFDQPYEERKYEDVIRIIRRDHELVKLYGKYTDTKEYGTEEQPNVQLEVGKQVLLKSGKVARLFNDLDGLNPYLSIFNIVDFVWNDNEYSSPYQAFEYTRLRENGYESKATAILKIRNTKTIKAVVSRIPGLVKDISQVWKDILDAYYRQNDSMLDKLINTKDDLLVFTSDIPYLGGVGAVSYDDKLWKYPNIVGNVLMKIRSELKQVVGGKLDEKKEVLGKRIGAIIHAKRSLKKVGGY